MGNDLNKVTPAPQEKKPLTVTEFYDRPAVFEVAGEELTLTPNIVKTYLTRGNEEVSQQELVMFINLCRYQKLNPFLNEAYLVKFKNNNGPAIAQIITSKEAYLKRAYDCPNYDGMESGIIVERDKKIVELDGMFFLGTDIILGGWAKVYTKDKPNHPTISKVSIQEYSKGQSTWKSMPATMIRKVAQAQALREAFPKELGSLYIEEEPTFDKSNIVQNVENAKEVAKNQTGSTPIPPAPTPKAKAPKPIEDDLPFPTKNPSSDEERDKAMSEGQVTLNF